MLPTCPVAHWAAMPLVQIALDIESRNNRALAAPGVSMYHHDSRPRHIAITDTAERFQKELDTIIASRRASATAVIDRVQRENPDDRLASTHALRFEADGGRVFLGARSSRFHQPLHRHALGQVADRSGVPTAFVSRLLAKPWGAPLLANILNQIFAREDERRVLVRSVGDEVRGVLSDQYRRMDSRPILDAFSTACSEMGVVPVEGVAGDLRFCVRALLPVVYRPGDEVVAFGVEISSSDFGAGALSVRTFALRVWCTNFARLDEELRKVHLGRRLDDTIAFSQQTHALDTAAISSAVRDIVRGAMSPSKVQQQVALIERAMTEKIDFKAALNGLPKLGMLKAEVEAVRDVLTSGGIEQLPIGNSTYRMSNALSWVAKSAETAERRLELETLAGRFLLGAKPQQAQLEAA